MFTPNCRTYEKLASLFWLLGDKSVGLAGPKLSVSILSARPLATSPLGRQHNNPLVFGCAPATHVARRDVVLVHGPTPLPVCTFAVAAAAGDAVTAGVEVPPALVEVLTTPGASVEDVVGLAHPGGLQEDRKEGAGPEYSVETW